MAAAPFYVVALVTSAGGLSALSQVLLPLPDDFSAALVIVQHLGGSGSSLVDILRRRSPLPAQPAAGAVDRRPRHAAARVCVRLPAPAPA
jgi:two-component system chemotaxis response regulator CheB